MIFAEIIPPTAAAISLTADGFNPSARTDLVEKSTLLRAFFWLRAIKKIFSAVLRMYLHSYIKFKIIREADTFGTVSREE